MARGGILLLGSFALAGLGFSGFTVSENANAFTSVGLDAELGSAIVDDRDVTIIYADETQPMISSFSLSSSGMVTDGIVVARGTITFNLHLAVSEAYLGGYVDQITNTIGITFTLASSANILNNTNYFLASSTSVTSEDIDAFTLGTDSYTDDGTTYSYTNTISLTIKEASKNVYTSALSVSFTFNGNFISLITPTNGVYNLSFGLTAQANRISG